NTTEEKKTGTLHLVVVVERGPRGVVRGSLDLDGKTWFFSTRCGRQCLQPPVAVGQSGPTGLEPCGHVHRPCRGIDHRGRRRSDVRSQIAASDLAGFEGLTELALPEDLSCRRIESVCPGFFSRHN